jgi:hypothetical protein
VIPTVFKPNQKTPKKMSVLSKLLGIKPFNGIFWIVDLGGSSFTAKLVQVVHGCLKVIKTVKSKALAKGMTNDFINAEKGTFVRNGKPASWPDAAGTIVKLLAKATKDTPCPIYVCETGPRRAEAVLDSNGKMIHPKGWSELMRDAIKHVFKERTVLHTLFPSWAEAHFSVQTFWSNPAALANFSFMLEIGSTSTQCGLPDGEPSTHPMLGCKSCKGLSEEEITSILKDLLNRAGLSLTGPSGVVFIMGALPYDARDLVKTHPELWLKYKTSGPLSIDALLALNIPDSMALLRTVLTELRKRGFDAVVFDPKPVSKDDVVAPPKGLDQKGWLLAVFAENILSSDTDQSSSDNDSSKSPRLAQSSDGGGGGGPALPKAM